MTPLSLEDRLAALEQEVGRLKQRLEFVSFPRPASKGNWMAAVSGSFKDDPEFDEVLRLGRLARAADFPDDDRVP